MLWFDRGGVLCQRIFLSCSMCGSFDKKLEDFGEKKEAGNRNSIYY